MTIYPSLIRRFPLILPVASSKFTPTNKTLKRLCEKLVGRLQSDCSGALCCSYYSSPFCPFNRQPEAFPRRDRAEASARHSDHQAQRRVFECLLNPPVGPKWPSVNRPLPHSDHTGAFCSFGGCLTVLTAANRTRGLRKEKELITSSSRAMER